MDRFKELTKEEGINEIPYIWTVFLSMENDLWANPFQNRKMRHRCLFVKNDTGNLDIYIHLSEKEISQLPEVPLPEKVYFYGAYNQLNVIQIRAYGVLREVLESAERRLYEEKMLAWLEENIIKDNCHHGYQPDAKEKENAVKNLKEGKVFHFVPENYAYHHYERG